LFESDKNKLIDDFKQNRSIFSNRLASLALDNRGHDIDSLGAFERGFGPLHNDVMTFAFLAAYTGANPVDYFVGEGSTTPQFPTSLPEQVGKRSYIPAPNWNLKYNGLSKLPMFQNMFSSVSIRHGYKSNLRVNQFKSDLEFVEDVPGLQRFIDPEKPNLDYFSRFEVPTIEISEQFAPLIGIDLKTRQNLNLNFEYAKARDLSLQTGIIQQLVERSSTELIFGFGWVIPNVNIGFLTIFPLETIVLLYMN